MIFTLLHKSEMELTINISAVCLSMCLSCCAEFSVPWGHSTPHQEWGRNSSPSCQAFTIPLESTTKSLRPYCLLVVKYFNVTSCKGFTLAFEILLQINIFVRYIYIFIIYFSLHTTRKWLYISIFLSYFPFKIEVTLRWWYRLCVKIYLDLWPTWQIHD